MFYAKSPVQDRYERTQPLRWGAFVRYLEFDVDGYPVRQVDAFANGFLLRYDRSHREDRFGNLAQFKLESSWRDHWGIFATISRADFENLWDDAADSLPVDLLVAASDAVPSWIERRERARGAARY